MNKQANIDAEEPVADATANPRSLVAKLKIPGIVAAIMIVELVGVVIMMPRAASSPDAHDENAAIEEHTTADTSDHGGDAAAPASTEAKGHGKKDEHSGPPAPPKPPTATEEVDLGEFSVTSYQPASNTTLFISFHLFGTLQHKNGDELKRRIDDSKHRIRDNIIVIIRSAEITDLTDAGLGLIKRRILETTNKTLGKPLLQGVVFSEFSFVEQ